MFGCIWVVGIGATATARAVAQHPSPSKPTSTRRSSGAYAADALPADKPAPERRPAQLRAIWKCPMCRKLALHAKCSNYALSRDCELQPDCLPSNWKRNYSVPRSEIPGALSRALPDLVLQGKPFLPRAHRLLRAHPPRTRCAPNNPRGRGPLSSAGSCRIGYP